MVDWGAGNYERTAVELEPVARAVIDAANLSGGQDVLDLACGTGNAALLAAASGARVIAVDAAPRLLAVARDRAAAQGVVLDLREGDLLAVPVPDDAIDVVLSIFGVIFASDPASALREIGRVLRPGGRALFTAWIPAGPIDAMLAVMGRIAARVSGAARSERFPWFDRDAVGSLAGEAGLLLGATVTDELAIRGVSPEAYVADGEQHPMALAMAPAIERAGVAAEVREVMTAVLDEANEDAGGFLVHSPYVVHELTADPTRTPA